MTRVALVLVVLLAAVAAGCGDEEKTSTDTGTTTTTTTSAETADVRVYFLLDGKVWPVAREVEEPAVAAGALEELFDGPTAEERVQFGFRTAIPGGGPSLAVDNRVARVLQPQGAYSQRALAQITYTLTQFPTISSVEVGGKRYTRGDFEDVTPAILVESPLYFQHVGNPVRATGTANTFEATFQYQLTDTDGKIVDENFVTATSGSGTRGTFDFTTKPYEIPFDGVGALIVYEHSMKDGSRIHLREIPVRMSR